MMVMVMKHITMYMKRKTVKKNIALFKERKIERKADKG